MFLARVTLPDRNCATCTLRQKQKWGCEKDVAPFAFDGEKLTRCPLRPLLDNPTFHHEVGSLYIHYKNRFLAEEGGINDQPAAYLQSMEIISAAVSAGEHSKMNNEIIDREKEDKKVDELRKLGLNVTPK